MLKSTEVRLGLFQKVKKVEFPIQECKSDLREHDNVVECIEWAPDSALENVQKAAGLDSKNNSGPFLVSGSRDKLIKVIFLKIKGVVVVF